MKMSTFALIATLSGMSAAHASEFDGAWLGAKLGYNQSDQSGLNKVSATAFGLEGGYNWDVDAFLLGVDGFADLNGSAAHNPGLVSYGSRAYGLEGKFGRPMGDWLPYAKLGFARTIGNGDASQLSGSGAHLGLGVEYKFNPGLSVTGEYSNASINSGAVRFNNDNFMLGLNYYFDRSVPVLSTAVARREMLKVAVPVEETKPVVAPVDTERKEVFKTLLEDRPVTFTGVNFDTDSVRLSGDAKIRLDEVAEFARLYPDAQLSVSGYTDYRAGKSKKAYNRKLSERRAAAFKAALVERGVAAERISTEGFGFARPVADNKTEAGRAQNRRVEIRSVIKEE